MWLSFKSTATTLNAWNDRYDRLLATAAEVNGKAQRLEIENTRLRADLDWFKLRLNQVEKERGQLIQAAIGVKVSVPEFVPAREDPEDTFNEMPDFSTVGENALEDRDGAALADEAGQGSEPDYSGMPRKTRG